LTKVVPIRRHFSFEDHLQCFILEKRAQGISQRTEKDYWYFLSFFFRKYPDALMLFMLDTGIRPGEALQLMKSDFDFRSLEVTIRSEVSKTRQKRTLPISPEVSNIIQKLLAVRPSGWFNSPFFPKIFFHYHISRLIIYNISSQEYHKKVKKFFNKRVGRK